MEPADFKRAAPSAGGPGAGYFALLGLPERFAVDLAELERSYLERSRQVHPDRFVTAPPRERVQALQASMQLNEAYKTLKKPHSRAEYLLVRRGVTIGDNEVLDPEFLMEVLELREELAGAKLAGDKATLGRLEAAMTARQDATLAAVAAHFAQLEQGADSPGAVLAELKKQIILLRYIRRYLEELEDLDDPNE
jgi:molecular chaperone HscB